MLLGAGECATLSGLVVAVDSLSWVLFCYKPMRPIRVAVPPCIAPARLQRCVEVNKLPPPTHCSAVYLHDCDDVLLQLGLNPDLFLGKWGQEKMRSCKLAAHLCLPCCGKPKLGNAASTTA